MIDIHSHIIPKIDDGSKSTEMTLEMLKIAERENTKKIVATPHYFKGYFTTLYEDVVKHVDELRNLAKDNKINIDIYHGQEVYFFDYMVKELEEGKIGTINNSRYMLIEFPMRHFDKNIMEVLYELQIRGITPVIAHPERYRYFSEKPSGINKLIDEGYLFQMNGGSIIGNFGKDVKKNSEIFLENGIYSFIGSDAHSLDRRNPGLSKIIDTITSKYDENHVCRFNNNGMKLIDNEELSFEGERIKEKKGFFSFLKRK